MYTTSRTACECRTLSCTTYAEHIYISKTIRMLLWTPAAWLCCACEINFVLNDVTIKMLLLLLIYNQDCLLKPHFEWCTALKWSHKEKKKKILPSSCLVEKALQLRQSFTQFPRHPILGQFSGAEMESQKIPAQRKICQTVLIISAQPRWAGLCPCRPLNLLAHQIL